MIFCICSAIKRKGRLGYMERKLVSILIDDVLHRIEKTSAKLDWDWPHSPPNMVKFTPRKNSAKWFYAYFGEQNDECLRRANEYTQSQIDKLQVEIDQLKSKMKNEENTIVEHGYIK